MKPQIPWLRVFVEGVVIVGSILLAFGIQAAWDERQEHQEAVSLLEGLRSEFQEHADSLAVWLTVTESRATALEAGLGRLGEGRSETIDVAGLDSAFYSLLNVADWDLKGGVLDGVIASGRLSLMGGEVLQRELASWSGSVDDVLDNQRLMQGFVLGEVIPTLAARGAPVSPIWASEFSCWSASVESASEAGAAYERLVASPEVRGLMGTKYSFVADSVGDIERALSKARAIVTLIEQELAR